jgi:diguanylate cyclase (GGDEF)-like protein/PAS domain S-box-containing protein
VVVLVGLQLLFAMAVMAAVWGSSQHLRRLALEHLLDHAQVQTHNLEDRLSQSFHLLHMHLRTLMVEHPEPADAPAQFTTALQALQHKLPYLRSLSAMDAQGRIVVSTHAANVGQQLALGRLLPQVAPQTPGLLRFGPPWQGRDFADGAPWPQQRLAQSVADAGFFPVTLVLPEAPQWTLVAAINSDYFINLALNHRVSSELRYRVYADDGTLLFSSAEDDQPGMPLAQHARLQEVLARQVGTAQWPQEGLDDTWLVAFRVSRSYPWFVQSQASRHEVLADWRSETRTLAWMAGVTLLALLLVTGTLTYWVQRSWVQEQRHREESRLAASVFAHSSDLIAITDCQGRVVAVNPAFEQGMGWSAQQVRGRRLGEWVDGRAPPVNFPEMWAALCSQGTWQGEVQERRKDASALTGWLVVNAVRDHAGQVVNYVGVLRDISRLRADEATIRKLSLAVEQSPTSIVITSTAPTIEYANPQFFRTTGYTPEEVLGANPRVLQSGQTPSATYQAMWAALVAGHVWQGEFVNRRKDGSLYVEQATVAPLTDAGGQTTHYLGIKQDITAHKEAEKTLRLAASVMEHTHDGVMVCDVQQRIIDVNPAFTRITGYTRAQALGQRPGMLSSGRRNTEQSRLMWLALLQVGHWQGEFWNRRSDGSLYAAASTINAVSDESGQVTHYINVFSDITERKHHQEHLERQAHFDPLTRLPNRALLPDRLAQAMARACSEQHGLAVCFLDLDGFKAVNDTHGHEAGDELLVIVAQRLQAHIRTGDTAARLGGDEFVVLLCDLRDLHECEQVAQRLLRAICEPMVVEGHTVQVGASMGIALYPQHGSQAEQLLRLADQAMYQAKQSGRNRCIFHAIEGESAQRVVLR